MTELIEDEGVRVAKLLDAEAKAVELFEAVESQRLIAPGVGERQASDAIRDLAAEMFGVSRFWHKRIVRSGPNTLTPYRENPPDRLMSDDDIVICDFGPIFEQWEADLGRTYVLGDDPVKRKICHDLAEIWAAGRAHFEQTPDITGAQLYRHMHVLAEQHGWIFGGDIAGHLVGQFPHEKIAGDDVESYITDGCDTPMRRLDLTGRVCHWILEVHLVEPGRTFGAFYEQLLDLSPVAPTGA